MVYSRRNHVEEQQEACLRAKHITTVCEQFHFMLDPIDWEEFGMWAPVRVNNVEIALLQNFRQQDSNDILRQVQIKLFEHAALETLHPGLNLKALIWSPIELIQPQEFLSLWAITLETDERVPIIESIRDDQRIYEHYLFDSTDAQQLLKLFGPADEGDYQPGDVITIKERERHYSGKIVYVISPSKIPTSRKNVSRGYHTTSGAVYTNTMTARYIVDCNDGFPHIAHQWQITGK